MSVYRSQFDATLYRDAQPFPINIDNQRPYYVWFAYVDTDEVFFGSQTIPSAQSFFWPNWASDPASVLAAAIRINITNNGGAVPTLNTFLDDPVLFENDWGINSAGDIVRFQCGTSYTFPGLAGGPYADDRDKYIGFSFSREAVSNPYVSQLSDYIEAHDGTIKILINQYKPIE